MAVNLNRRQEKYVRRTVKLGRAMGMTRKQVKAALEAEFAESGVRNLNYGDRDSEGILQQRPSTGWGPASETAAQDIRQFFAAAKKADRPGLSAGALAQAVQRSAFPSRYAEHSAEADALLREHRGLRLGGHDAGGGGILGREQNVDVGLKTTFDKTGFEDARRAAILGRLIAKRRGTDSPLFSTGLLTTDMPSAADFTDTKLTSKVVKGDRVRESSHRRVGGAGKIHGGGGWAGTKAIAYAATEGLPRTSEKRTPAHNAAVGGAQGSDHLTTKTNAYAVDTQFGSGHTIAKRLGIKDWSPGTYTWHTIRAAGGHVYRVQILERVEGHFDHTHVGVERVS